MPLLYFERNIIYGAFNATNKIKEFLYTFNIYVITFNSKFQPKTFY